jgi:hypothetical protein
LRLFAAIARKPRRDFPINLGEDLAPFSLAPPPGVATTIGPGLWSGALTTARLGHYHRSGAFRVAFPLALLPFPKALQPTCAHLNELGAGHRLFTLDVRLAECIDLVVQLSQTLVGASCAFRKDA